MNFGFYHMVVCVFLVSSSLSVMAQDKPEKVKRLSLNGEISTVSKYVWRGLRLTDGPSLQSSATVKFGNLSFQLWGNLDLVAVNEGGSKLLEQNPAAAGRGGRGLQGRFSEIDYILNYSIAANDTVAVDVGAIVYTYPYPGAFPITTEVFGSVAFQNLLLRPKVAVYVDVDETLADGNGGVYFQFSAAHVIPLGYQRVPGINLSGSIGFAERGFAEHYYGHSHSGFHDVGVTATLPVSLGKRVSLTPFISAAALLGESRNFQFISARDIYRGTAGSPASYADTVWGGITLSFQLHN